MKRLVMSSIAAFVAMALTIPFVFARDIHFNSDFGQRAGRGKSINMSLEWMRQEGAPLAFVNEVCTFVNSSASDRSIYRQYALDWLTRNGYTTKRHCERERIVSMARFDFYRYAYPTKIYWDRHEIDFLFPNEGFYHDHGVGNKVRILLHCMEELNDARIQYATHYTMIYHQAVREQMKRPRVKRDVNEPCIADGVFSDPQDWFVQPISSTRTVLFHQFPPSTATSVTGSTYR